MIQRRARPLGRSVLTTSDKIRIARVLSRTITLGRAILRQPRIARVQRRDVTFELDLAEGIDLAMYLGVYERGTYRALRRLVRPGSTVLDIGANVGVHTLPLADMVGPDGRVIAFEPTTYAFGRLARNLELNPRLAPRVTAVRGYLGDGAKGRPAAFYSRWSLQSEPRQHPFHGGSLESAGEAEEWTLDAFTAATKAGPIALFKIDVDGFECKVLRGAMATIARDHPAIVSEICPYALEERGDSVEEMLALFRQLNYELFDESGRERIALDPVAVTARIAPRSSVNVVALAAASEPDRREIARSR